MSTRALQIDVLMSPVHDYRDNSIASGYTVSFYSAGTSTAKNVWTEKEKTNPYTSRTLGSNGTVQVYGDGVYKIVIADTDGTTVYEWDNVKIQSPNIAVLEKAATYTATVDDDYILVNTTAGNVTINLYTAASFTHPICIKNIGTNSVVIDPYSTQLIEGASTYTINTQDAAVWLFSNLSAWYVANDVSQSSVDAINLVASVGGDKKLTAKATTVDIETNDEYLRQLNAAGDGYVNLIKANASDQTELASGALLKGSPTVETDLYVTRNPIINTNNTYLKSKDAAGTGTVDLVKANANDRVQFGAAVQTFQAHDGTNTIDFPTNGMAAAKFMLGNSSTIAWFYLNTAPPGWKVLATGADTILAVSGGAAAYNANGGTAGGTWTQPNHTHTGPSHTHGLGTMAGPNHTHTLTSTTTGASYGSADSPVVISTGNLYETPDPGASTAEAASATTGNPSATALTGAMASGGTGATSGSATANTWRPSASVGKLYQLDSAA